MATNDEVANHLGISPTRVSQLKSAGILPEARRRANDLDACRAAYLEHIREVAAGRSAAYGGLELVAERARLARAQAENMERKNAIQDGQYLETRAVHIMATTTLLIVRSHLLAIPPRLAPLVAPDMTPAAEQTILQKEIYATLDEMAATNLADYDHSNEFATRSIADLLHGEQETMRTAP